MDRAFRIAALAVLSLLGWSGAARAQDDYDARVQRAHDLYEREQYAEARKEVEAAYALRQSPKLLYLHAKVHQRLGHAREALDFYQRYLAADDDATLRADAQVNIERLRPLVPAPVATGDEHPPGTQLVRVRFETRKDSRYIIAGSVLLAVGYVPAFICGILFSLFDGPAGPAPLLVPVAGPFISGLTFPLSQSSYNRNSAGLYWSLPWILVDGTIQALGLGLLIKGVRTDRKVPVLGESIRVAPFMAAGSGGLALSGAF